MTLKNINILLVFSVLATAAISYFYLFPPTTFQRLCLKCKNCEVAKQLAQSDFEQENYQFIEWGLPDSDHRIIDSIRLADYNIKTLHGGCMPLSEVYCYQEQMWKLLVKKYGYFEKVTYQKYKKIKPDPVD